MKSKEKKRSLLQVVPVCTSKNGPKYGERHIKDLFGVPEEKKENKIILRRENRNVIK